MPADFALQVLHWNQRVLLTRYIKPEFPDGIYKYNLNDSEVFLKHLYPQGVRIIGGWLGSVDPPISQTIAFAVVDTQRYAAIPVYPASCFPAMPCLFARLHCMCCIRCPPLASTSVCPVQMCLVAAISPCLLQGVYKHQSLLCHATSRLC